MTEPRIVPRAEHPISRRDIDPDALRVLQRLQQSHHAAYLVGGGVRDLLLGRHPKDFDIGTSAHPHQIKKLFRNCWIIGRRFRLAHIKFGQKTIEVATFRKNVPEPPQEAQTLDPSAPSMVAATSPADEPQVVASSPMDPRQLHHENSFGTAEEDAFRRDFTINALFYDIATFAVIDYVGGLEDLKHRLIRSIGDPNLRFKEDPVRMLRAAVFAARLGFQLDEPVADAIEEHGELITTASPSRLIEEYLKILRSGYAEATFRELHRLRLLELMTPELKTAPPALWESLARLDRWRRQSPTHPAEMTNPILIGALLVPLGTLARQAPGPRTSATDRAMDRVSFGMLPIARKDIERLRHVLTILPRLTDPEIPARLVRSLPGRPSFPDAVTWLEIFGDAPEALERWKLALAQRVASPEPSHPHHRQPHHPQHPPAEPGAGAGIPSGRPRRRRRRRRGRGGSGGGSGPA